MSMAVGGPGEGPKADINMTPLIDVLLVLLIIFMVITPLTPKGLETLVPQPPPPGTPPSKADDRTVVIIIEKNGAMKINTEDTTEANLGPRLEEIFVKGDPDIEYQFVARAIDTAKGVGIDKVGLMTAKMEEGN
jgi:biopolymer transport protein TolR